MPNRVKQRRSKATETGTEVRHKYQPADFVTDGSWKTIFPLVDPMVSVTLDRGTFEWLWDFTARKGRQADASNFYFSDTHRDVYQRAADQFALAAQEAFGDTYLVKEPVKSVKKVAEVPAEPSVEPPKPRRRRKPVSASVEKFEPSKSLTESPVRKRRRRRRSAT